MPLTPTRAAVAQDLGERAQLILGTAYGASQNITGATNATPIVLTVTAHGYTTGAIVTVADVRGNTAANGRWQITRVDANTFQLNGSAGNAAYVSSTGIVASGTGVAGYYLSNNDRGSSLKIKPQQSRSQSPVYIGADRSLTMRDSDWYSRVYMNDWRGGGGQVTADPSVVQQRNRFYDSLNAEVSLAGQVGIIRAMASLYSGDLTAVRKPMTLAQQYLYVGSFSSVKWSSANDWSAPSTAACATSGTIGNTIGGLVSDGQYVYGTVGAGGGAGINRWAVNDTTAATVWNTTATGLGAAAPGRIIYANRRIYAIGGTNFYEVALATGTGTSQFTPAGTWRFQDLCALTGGAIDAAIIMLASQGGASGGLSIVWLWDGTTIHDYTPLPNGFVAQRMKQYLGVTYITGYQSMPSSRTADCVYVIDRGQLNFLGYLAGLPQTNGDPAEWGTGNPVHMDFFGTGAYFHMLNSTTSRNEVWRYDIVNGGFTRWAQVQVPTSNNQQNEDIIFFQNGAFMSIGTNAVQNDRVYGQQAAYAATAQVVSSDLNLGQPWAVNMWVTIEVSHSPLTTGQSVQTEYSTDMGVTWTSAGTQSTVGANADVWTISNSSTSVKGPYIRVRSTLSAGATNTTTPLLNSVTVKADPSDPTGGVIEAYVSCADASYMPKGGPDWQGLSGQERMQLIVDLFNLQSLTTLIYMGSNTTRAKNPTTVTVNVTNYEIEENASVGLGPEKTVEGTVKVEMRIV